MKAAALNLAARKGKLAVTDASRAADMAVDRHIVGQVGKDEVDALVTQQPRVILAIARIAAQQAVAPALPHIPAPADRTLGRRDHRILGGVRSRRIGLDRTVEHEIDFREAEAGECYVEVEVDERLQFDCQDFLIPAGISASLLSAIT